MADVTITLPLATKDAEAGLDYVVELANAAIRAQNLAMEPADQVPELTRESYLEYHMGIAIESYAQQYLANMAGMIAEKYKAADTATRISATAALKDVVVGPVEADAKAKGKAAKKAKP